MNGMDNRRTILHVLAGGYLIYLAYGIFKGIINGETASENLVLIGVCGAAFGVVGAGLLIHALVVRLKASREENPAETGGSYGTEEVTREEETEDIEAIEEREAREVESIEAGKGEASDGERR